MRRPYNRSWGKRFLKSDGLERESLGPEDSGHAHRISCIAQTAVTASDPNQVKIPYANCDFADIRREGFFYADKTAGIPALEDAGGSYLIFLRPRRFGKSTLLSTLANYYDIETAGEFDELFGGLWIHAHPTPKKNKYLVLRLDFSCVESEGTVLEIRRSFTYTLQNGLRPFLARYSDRVPEFAKLRAELDTFEDPSGLIGRVLSSAQVANAQVYLLIDEYDHFGNRLLSDGQEDLYRQIVRGTGFVRSFYATLKAFTSTTTLARMFITGVSPIMLDDLSSGFNIITHVSQRDTLNTLTGFTQAEVEQAVDTLLRDKPELKNDPRIGDRAALLQTLERYYDGYRFSLHASERVYNSTLVLYFLRELVVTGRYPRQMLDLNVRTDYGRIYRIAMLASAKESDTREFLEEILTHESILSPLVEQFGLLSMSGHTQLVSLFYYMGMLTFAADAGQYPVPMLVIPNRVMRELQWEYLSVAMAQHEGIRMDMRDIDGALVMMAQRGDIQPLLRVFHEHVIKRMSNRDLIQFDEKTMKLMLMAYLAQTQVFNIVSEQEFAQGYCDLLLGLRDPASAMKYAWMIEAKYVKTDASQDAIEEAVKQGFEQIQKYASDKDLVAMLTLGNSLKAGVLVFVGLKDVLFRSFFS